MTSELLEQNPESYIDHQMRRTPVWIQRALGLQSPGTIANNVRSDLAEAVWRSEMPIISYQDGELFGQVAFGGASYYSGTGPGIQARHQPETDNARSIEIELLPNQANVLVSPAALTVGPNAEATREEAESVNLLDHDSLQIFWRDESGRLFSQCVLLDSTNLESSYKLVKNLYGVELKQGQPLTSANLMRLCVGQRLDIADLQGDYDKPMHSLLERYAAISDQATADQCQRLIEFDKQMTVLERQAGDLVVNEYMAQTQALADSYHQRRITPEVSQMINGLRLGSVAEFRQIWSNYNSYESTSLDDVLTFIENNALKPAFERRYALAINAIEARTALGDDHKAEHKRTQDSVWQGQGDVMSFWFSQADHMFRMAILSQVKTGGAGCNSANGPLDYDLNNLSEEDQSLHKEVIGLGYKLGTCVNCTKKDTRVGGCSVCIDCEIADNKGHMHLRRAMALLDKSGSDYKSDTSLMAILASIIEDHAENRRRLANESQRLKELAQANDEQKTGWLTYNASNSSVDNN